MPSIRLGTASPATQATTAKTIELLSQIATEAAAQNIDILLLPEAIIGGYPRGSAFGCVVGNRSEAGRSEYASYFASAVDLGDTVGDGAGAGDGWVRKQLATSSSNQPRGDGTREELERISSETGVFIVTGLIEKVGGSLYCAAVYVDPKNGMVGKRRKVMPTGTERLIWAQGCPSTLKAVTTVIRGQRVNIGTAICWESYMPLVRQALYSQNINLYLAPTADGREEWLSLMKTVAIEGRCFVVSSNMCVRDDDDDDDDDDDKDQADNNNNGKVSSSWLSRGGSSIVNPFGKVLAGPQWEDGSGLVFADVEFGECIGGRLDFDTGGSYSRNDSFTFRVKGLDLDPLPY